MGLLETVKLLAAASSTFIASSSFLRSGSNVTDIVKSLQMDPRSLASRLSGLDPSDLIESLQIVSKNVKKDDGCDFGEAYDKDVILCDGGSSLRRNGRAVQIAAEKALECAAAYSGTECILSAEIGLVGLPAFWTWAAEDSTQLMEILLPTATSASDFKSVVVKDPAGIENSDVLSLPTNVRIQHMERRGSTGFSLRSASLSGDAALCFGLLNHSLRGICSL